MRRILAGVMASAICLTLSVSAFAATGYSTGSSGGGSGSYTPPASSNTSAPTTAQVTNKANQAIKAAAGKDSATVSLKDATSLTAEAIKAVAAKAAAAKIPVTIQVDKTSGKTVVSRWYIDPAKAANLTGKLNLDVKVDAKSVAATINTFGKYFSNDVAVVGLGQKGSFGMSMDLAVKVDLSGLDTSKLTFYTYDKATGVYAPIAAPAYFVDKNGYLHFTTSVGGDIVITDSPLTKK